MKWLLLAALFVTSRPLSAQDAIDWFTIDGGGGASSNGQYSVSGTLGQPDAGAMSGGSFTLQGGFWGVVAAVQTPGAPTLSITRAGSDVVVSWPLPADGWVLEQTNRLASASEPWPTATWPCVTNASDIRVTMPAAPGHRFFRLHKP
ncbi:MAG: hypothetical protein HZA90_14735 [Verrucomicrobia bacterium]|nr:hypothetical protein [Verrucomicrobiota bacterium]